jgi:tRNA threonylcarbamoyladenosine biosynthesis protein TsaE
MRLVVIELICESETDTRAAAGRLASLCRPGDVIVLNGALGAGKTAFTSGLADGLGVEEVVTSPTFVVMRRYDSGFLPLVHVDVYRLGSTGEFEDLDALDEGRDGVVVIEWGEAVAALLPPDRLTVSIDVRPDEVRSITMVGSGVWTARPLRELVA